MEKDLINKQSELNNLLQSKLGIHNQLKMTYLFNYLKSEIFEKESFYIFNLIFFLMIDIFFFNSQVFAQLL